MYILDGMSSITFIYVIVKNVAEKSGNQCITLPHSNVWLIKN